MRLPLLLALTLSATLHAQESYVSAGVSDPAEAPSAAGTYRIRLQDELRVTVFDEPELAALALAGGLNERGSDRRIRVRRLANGRLTHLSIDLVDQVQPGDTLTIASWFL